MEMMVGNVFFADMRVVEANCDAQGWLLQNFIFQNVSGNFTIFASFSGTVVSLSAPSTSTTFSTAASDSWKEALFKSKKVSKLSLRRTEDAKDSYVLDVIERAGL